MRTASVDLITLMKALRSGVSFLIREASHPHRHHRWSKIIFRILYEYLGLFLNWSEYFRISSNIGISKSHSSFGGEPPTQASQRIQNYIHPRCHHTESKIVIIITIVMYYYKSFLIREASHPHRHHRGSKITFRILCEYLGWFVCELLRISRNF